MGAKTTRIDFHRINTNADSVTTGDAPGQPVKWGYMVRFFTQGWDYFTNPYRIEVDPPMHDEEGRAQAFDIDITLTKLEASGWTVRRWPTGARAWRGPATPVRTREEILRMRRRQSARLAESHGQPEPEFTTFIDYAYEG